MANKLMRLLNFIPFVHKLKNKKMEKEAEVPVKHYSFMIAAEGISKHVSIDAKDKAEAVLKVKMQYPGCTASFLWEYTRRTLADLYPDKSILKMFLLK